MQTFNKKRDVLTARLFFYCFIRSYKLEEVGR